MTTASPPPAVRADGLVLAFGRRPAVDRASFSIGAGRTVALIGPNGSGKSTLLRALAGLLPPRQGTLEVAARARRAAVALVLQATDVDRHLPITVGEAVTLARYGQRGPFRPLRRSDRRAVASALARLGLEDMVGRQVHELSGGQRQRMLVAQGLAQEAELVLLDEPVTGLDLVSRQLILDAVDTERAAGRTVVWSTHDLGEAARADLVLLMANRVVAFGPPAEVLAEEPLTEAYGGRVVRLSAGLTLLDDPHHDHAPHDPALEPG